MGTVAGFVKKVMHFWVAQNRRNLLYISETAVYFQKDSAPWGLLVIKPVSQTVISDHVYLFSLHSTYVFCMRVINIDAISGNFFFFSPQIHAIGVYFFFRLNSTIQYVKDIHTSDVSALSQSS